MIILALSIVMEEVELYVFVYWENLMQRQFTVEIYVYIICLES